MFFSCALFNLSINWEIDVGRPLCFDGGNFAALAVFNDVVAADEDDEVVDDCEGGNDDGSNVEKDGAVDREYDIASL